MRTIDATTLESPRRAGPPKGTVRADPLAKHRVENDS
jgi:hypothetical protein